VTSNRYVNSFALAKAMNDAGVKYDNYEDTMPSIWREGVSTWSVYTDTGMFVLAKDHRKWMCVYAHARGGWIVPFGDTPSMVIANGNSYVTDGSTVREFVSHIVEDWADGSDPDDTSEIGDFLDGPLQFSKSIEAELRKTTVVDEMASFEGGGVRASEDGKPDFSLLWAKDVPYEEQFLYKLAMHMTNGAKKYASRNWEKFHDAEALERAMRSKMRHAAQDAAGETDEEHNIAEAANCMFVHTIRWKVENGWTPEDGD